jgi:hypothetical protein
MKTLKIKIHSVVDVITNSSTTIYTQADEGTISSVKDMVNALLKIGGSELTADDLFTFSLVGGDDESDYGYTDVDLVVTCISDNEHAIVASRILNGLNDLFNHDAQYDS